MVSPSPNIFSPVLRNCCFVHMTAWLTRTWTSALDVATIGLRHHDDDSEQPIMMRNVSGLFHRVRDPVANRLSLIVDAV